MSKPSDMHDACFCHFCRATKCLTELFIDVGLGNAGGSHATTHGRQPEAHRPSFRQTKFNLLRQHSTSEMKTTNFPWKQQTLKKRLLSSSRTKKNFEQRADRSRLMLPVNHITKTHSNVMPEVAKVAIKAIGLPDESERDHHMKQPLHVLAYEITVAEARERQRIAQMLHDDLGQLLAIAQFKLGELTQNFICGGKADPFEDIRLLVCDAAKAARVTTFELHSSVLDQLGIDAAVNSLAQRLRRTSAMCVHVNGVLGYLALPEMVMSIIFRIVRELVQNAQRHASAENLWITLQRYTNSLSISVTDDGIGFDTDENIQKFSPNGGFGLFSAKAHMQAIGGSLLLSSSPGGGTTAIVEFGFNDNGTQPEPVTDSCSDPLATPILTSI